MRGKRETQVAREGRSAKKLMRGLSTVRKKMANGIFTYNALCTKTKRAYKNIKKNCKSFKLDKGNAVSIGTIAVKLQWA